MNGLCDHNQNPKACLACYNAGVASKPRSVPKPSAKLPKLNDVVKAVREQQGGIFAKQPDLEPTVTPTRVGYEADGSAIELKKGADGLTRGPRPKPVVGPPAAAGSPSTKVLEPFSYASQSAQASKTKVLDVGGVKMEVQVPPKHREVMDRLPRHPEAGGRR